MEHRVDTLIVGFGLAGLAYAETLFQAKKSFHVIDADFSGSSEIAAGIYNPTVLKRFNLTWRGDNFHRTALPFYDRIATRLKQKFDYPASIYKLFTHPGDHNRWTVAADRSGLTPFLEAKIYNDSLNGVHTPLGYAVVNQCGRIDTRKLIQTYRKQLASHFTQKTFDYSKLTIHTDGIAYEQISAKHIVFCEGFAMKNNPYFNTLPMVGSKGQILLIRSPQLQSKRILKGPIFIAPLGEDLYWAGATFEQEDKTVNKTAAGRRELEKKIKRMISVPYTIEEQLTHIRPTVVDRRPLIGTHKKHQRLHLLNGLGSRGVLMAPQAAQWLYAYITKGDPFPKEANINRFY